MKLKTQLFGFTSQSSSAQQPLGLRTTIPDRADIGHFHYHKKIYDSTGLKYICVFVFNQKSKYLKLEANYMMAADFW